MKKIIYFDCSSGISGNMILGALLDAGLDFNFLKNELNKIPVTLYSLLFTKSKQRGLQGTCLEVRIQDKETPRDLKKILSIIKKSKLSRRVGKQSIEIFTRLAQAEANVHGVKVGNVHLHEAGAVDAIVDIVGACIGLEKLGIEKIYCSPLPHGTGRIKCAHGYLPNPAPATVELLKGIPTYGTDMKGELVTPTGAAIISTLADSFGDMPRLKVERIGYGAGSIKLSIPNLLRVFIGEAELPTVRDAILQIEANIDDMNPKLYNLAIAKLMSAGALDASIHPIRMKKGRAAVKLEVLCRPEDKDKVLAAVFTTTTTIGTRVFLVKRDILRREIKHGSKISYLGKEIKRSKKE